MLNKSRMLCAVLSIGAFILVGCQTTKPAPVLDAVGRSMIETEAGGFSPASLNGFGTIEFSILFGNASSLVAWSIDIVGMPGVQRTITGTGLNLPSTFAWDGKTDSGGFSPDGSYRARLAIEYGGVYPAVSVQSMSFMLASARPSGTIVMNPAGFTSSAHGVVAPVVITLKPNASLAKLDSWIFDVTDDSGRLVVSFDSKWPLGEVTWDGKGLSGEIVSPENTYQGLLTMYDEYGNEGTLVLNVPVVAPPVVAPPVVAAPAAPVVVIPGSAGVLAVTPKTGGFSPNGDGVNDSMQFSVSVAEPGAVEAWKVVLSRTGQTAGRTLSGNRSNLPTSIAWDGMDDARAPSAEGTYAATLSVDYGKAFAPKSASSAPFVLDLTPPRAKIVLTPPLFSPIEPTDTLRIEIDASSMVAKIDSWSIVINDPAGHLFKSFDGKWPNKVVDWDGKGIDGSLVVSAEDYPLIVKIRDEFGNVGTVTTTIPIDILVLRTATGFRIPNSRIWFQAFTADYRNVPPVMVEQNLQRLDRLAEMLKKYPEYAITIVGHAVMIYWDQPELGAAEQKTMLVPLSQARAEAILQALVERGVASAVMTAKGVGASEQLVPDSDYANRWMNRRTAIFLDK
jgi:hypothetical protein